MTRRRPDPGTDALSLFTPAPHAGAGRADEIARAYVDAETARLMRLWADRLTGYSEADRPTGSPAGGPETKEHTE